MSGRSVTILGSTGTIGCNTLDVIAQTRESWDLYALTAGSNVERLIEQALLFHPKHAVIEDENAYKTLKNALSGTQIKPHAGKEAITGIAGEKVDITLCGILGAAALQPTMASIDAGNTIGLANKECLVCAGELMMHAAQKNDATIIPVDSEHNAIFQAMGNQLGDQKAIERITLTASGGPFRTTPRDALASVTADDATNHPNWVMGAKISVDSATMMNKGLELIEARYLFDLSPEQIDIVVHPESIIHGLVHYTDGSTIAGLSVPDMRIPIAQALAWPKRTPSGNTPLDLASLAKLTFEAPDYIKFPALGVARSALQSGQAACCLLNAANEIAVEAFLDQKIDFLAIVKLVETVIDSVPTESNLTLSDVIALDEYARNMTKELLTTI